VALVVLVVAVELLLLLPVVHCLLSIHFYRRCLFVSSSPAREKRAHQIGKEPMEPNWSERS